MKRSRMLLLLLLLGGIGCSSMGRLPVEAPQLRIAQREAPAFVMERGGTLAIQYLIEIENVAEIPVTARRIDLQAFESGPYVLRPEPFIVRREVEPGSAELIEISAWAYSYGGPGASVEPVTLRVTVQFESAKGNFQVSRVVRLAQ